MSSMKERVHIQIDDEEDEEEEVFEGRSMFELYSVVINEIKGSHIRGKLILFVRNEEPINIVIYDGDEGENNKIGEPLLLRGISEPFFAYDPFSIMFLICPKELGAWSKIWFNYGDPDGGVVTDVTVKERWGKVTLTYQKFDYAVRACVNVMFLGIDDDGKKKYPSRVYGEIYATSNGRIETKVVLFRKSKEEAEAVDNGEPIPLSRSVMAAQLGTRIQIHVDLWGCYDSSDIQTSFVGGLKVGSRPSTDEVEVEQPLYYESPVQVKVTWVEPPFPVDSDVDEAEPPNS